jgi:hypothetical protein
MRNPAFILVSLTILSACSERRTQETARVDRAGPPLEEALPDSGASSRRATTPPRAGPDERPLQLKSRPHVSSPRSAPPDSTTDKTSPARASTPIPSSSPGPDTASKPAAARASDTDVATEPRPPAVRDSAPSPIPGTVSATNRSDPFAPAARSLPAGTTVQAQLQDSLNSRSDSAGKIVMARINTAITDRNGQVVVPAASPVQLSVAQLEPAKTRSATDGKLVLRVDSVLVDGRAYPVAASVQPVPHELRGRGVSAGEAEKVGVGAAAGAVLGRVLGGNSKGTIIGGVVGAAGGAVVAAQTASRDVVVKPGTWVSFVLTAPLVVKE